MKYVKNSKKQKKYEKKKSKRIRIKNKKKNKTRKYRKKFSKRLKGGSFIQEPEYFRKLFPFNSYFTLIESELEKEPFEFIFESNIKPEILEGYKINILIQDNREDIIIPFTILKRKYNIKKYSAPSKIVSFAETNVEKEEGETIDFFYEYDHNTSDSSKTRIEYTYGFSINFSSNQIEKFDESLSNKIPIDNCIKVSKIQNVVDHKNKLYWFYFKDKEIKIRLCSDIYLNLENKRDIGKEIVNNPYETIIIENLETYISSDNCLEINKKKRKS